LKNVTMELKTILVVQLLVLYSLLPFYVLQLTPQIYVQFPVTAIQLLHTVLRSSRQKNAIAQVLDTDSTAHMSDVIFSPLAEIVTVSSNVVGAAIQELAYKMEHVYRNIRGLAQIVPRLVLQTEEVVSVEYATARQELLVTTANLLSDAMELF
jgi:hypothetical protein